jgi:hypothetical protein
MNSCMRVRMIEWDDDAVQGTRGERERRLLTTLWLKRFISRAARIDMAGPNLYHDGTKETRGREASEAGNLRLDVGSGEVGEAERAVWDEWAGGRGENWGGSSREAKVEVCREYNRVRLFGGGVKCAVARVVQWDNRVPTFAIDGADRGSKRGDADVGSSRIAHDLFL